MDGHIQNLPCPFGRYTLMERIACGGTAEIYRAVLTSENGFAKPVAVKRLLPLWKGIPELTEMLIDEAKVLCHLAHQSIVQVYELGSADGHPFLAMEFVEGIDCGRLLNHLLREKEPLPVGHALYIIGQVLTALDFAHRSCGLSGEPLQIVHRDISPSNILLSFNGEVKVTDFGIAKGSHRTHLTDAGQIRGKYAYMAPEHARGEGIDARADLFACGIVLFELLTATRFLVSHSDVEILQRVAHAEYSLEAASSLPPELRTILLLALAPKREHRYENAQAMLEDVQRAAQDLYAHSSTLELASYLAERFPRERLCMCDGAASKTEQGAGTRVIGGEGDVRPDGVIRFGRGLRGGIRIRSLLPLLLISFATIPAASSVSEPHILQVARAEQMPASSSQKGASKGVDTAPPPSHASEFSAEPEPAKGYISITSQPSGLSAKLTLDGEERMIVTPFTQTGIDLGDGREGRIEFDAQGFQPIAADFHLDAAAPAYVRDLQLIHALQDARLFVHARPWGIVSIPGVLRSRETPISGVRVLPGTHLVRVTHPPSGKKAATSVEVKAGESKRCIASLLTRPTIRCR